MTTFWIYLQLGFEHISTWNGRFFGFEGSDHLLFLVALVAFYNPREWRPVLILITAFTVGHSITLALATLGIMRAPSDWVEFLIPCTIFSTAVANYFVRVEQRRSPNFPSRRYPSGSVFRYAAAGLFGLVHGLGFSGYLGALLGAEASLTVPLFAFNLGLEVGQLLVVAMLLLVNWVAVDLVRIPRREWLLITSTAVAVGALQLVISTYPAS